MILEFIFKDALSDLVINVEYFHSFLPSVITMIVWWVKGYSCFTLQIKTNYARPRNNNTGYSFIRLSCYEHVHLFILFTSYKYRYTHKFYRSKSISFKRLMANITLKKKLEDVAGRLCEVLIPIKHEYYMGQGKRVDAHYLV